MRVASDGRGGHSGAYYATAIPLLGDEHLPQSMAPDTASRIKAEVSRRALAMVERDIGVLAE